LLLRAYWKTRNIKQATCNSMALSFGSKCANS
jgi:hypothetical protein